MGMPMFSARNTRNISLELPMENNPNSRNQIIERGGKVEGLESPAARREREGTHFRGRYISDGFAVALLFRDG